MLVMLSTYISNFSLIISVISCLGSIISAGYSYKQARKANKINSGQTEIFLRNLIFERKKTLNEFMLKYVPDDSKDELIKKIFESLIEDELNAYEEACSKYLDNKLDKKRFKQNYKDEIKKLTEDDDIFKIMSSKMYDYNSIFKVNDEFKNN